jgi:prepilin-type processing-associated H-X9-DG protein
MQDKGVLRRSKKELNGADIYNCPNDLEGNLRDFETGHKGHAGLQADALGRSYSINGYLSWNGHPNENKQGFSGIEYRSVTGRNRFLIWSQSVSRVINPSIVFMIVERPGAGWIGGGGAAVTGNAKAQEGFYDIRWWTNNRNVTPVFNNLKYHQNGWNYLFADGHVQNMLQEDSYGPGGVATNPKGYWSIRVTD